MVGHAVDRGSPISVSVRRNDDLWGDHGLELGSQMDLPCSNIPLSPHQNSAVSIAAWHSFTGCTS